MNETNFEEVVNFNKSFGIKVFDKPQTNITKEDPALIKYRDDLIDEEVKELKEAIDNHDFTEIVDALGDILYVVYRCSECF